MATQDQIRGAVAERAAGGTKAADPAQTIDAYLRRMAPEIKRALPAHMTADRLARVAMTTIRLDPKLLRCNVQSLIAAVMQAAQLGLEPGLLGQCYLIPFGAEVQFVVGYKGYIQLARRSREVLTIDAHEVCEHDQFEFAYGFDPKLLHVPALEDRGEITRFYAAMTLVGGGRQAHVMSRHEVDVIRAKAPGRNSPAWTDYYIEMGRKTPLRNLMKYAPLSVEIAKAVAADGTVKTDISEDMAEVPSVIDTTADDAAQAPEATPWAAS